MGVAVRLTWTDPAFAAGPHRITGVTDKAYRPERVEQMLSGKKLDAKTIDAAAAEATRNIEDKG